MTELNTLFQIFNNLSESEKKAFLKKIKGENLSNSTKSSKVTNICKCAHCNSANIVKNGTVRGVQRYLCRDCHKIFTPKTNTILFKTHYSDAVWRKYINCMMNGMSIRKSAKACGINPDTAFKWRHKILGVSRMTVYRELKVDLKH